MNNFKLADLISFLRRPQNSKSLLLLVATVMGAILVSQQYVIPDIKNYGTLQNEVKASQERLADLQAKRDRNLAKMKANQNKIENIPVKIYKPVMSDLPVESSSVEFVSSIISMLEQAGNSIVDISYKVDSIANEQKELIPANVSVVELTMSLSGTYADLQEFIFGLYDYSYLASVKSLRITPLRENKNIIETDIVIWLYISK